MRNWILTLARIDHAAGAAKVGKKLRATELLIFGNPQGGTPFMECGQTVGIDLPLKALVWQDESGQAHCPAVEGLRKALAVFVQQASSK